MAESPGFALDNHGSARGAPDEQQLLRTLLQRLPLAVALLDRDTAVRRLNPAAARMFGMHNGYASGRGLAGALAHDQRAAFRAQVAAVARGEGERSLVVRLLRSPGGVPARSADLELRTTLTPLRPPREPHTAVLAVFQQATAPPPRPASPEVPLEEPRTARPDLAEATRSVELLDLVDDMAAALLTAGSRQAVTEGVGSVLYQRFADWVIIDLTFPGRCLERVAVYAEDTAVRTAVIRQLPEECPLVVDAVRHQMEALRVRPEDPEALGLDSTGAPVLSRAKVSSLLCVPLRTGLGDPVMGALTLLRSGGRLAFALAEAGATDRMARHIALALRRL
jgi:PAS domain S-box-containing protein